MALRSAGVIAPDSTCLSRTVVPSHLHIFTFSPISPFSHYHTPTFSHYIRPIMLILFLSGIHVRDSLPFSVVLPKRRGRVKSATRVFVSISSLIMSVLSTQYESREKSPSRSSPRAAAAVRCCPCRESCGHYTIKRLADRPPEGKRSFSATSSQRTAFAPSKHPHLLMPHRGTSP